MNRWLQLQEIGCLACKQLGYYQPSDCHHLLSGHVRRGHEFTIPLCPYHHRNLWNDRFANRKIAESMLGPSLAQDSKKFHERFGSDDELLALANQLIEKNAQRSVNWRPEPTEIDEFGHLIVQKPAEPAKKRTKSSKTDK